MAKPHAPAELTEKARREARLAQALRSNLRKRKAPPPAGPPKSSPAPSED
jgi:hypothetical protein